MRKFEGRIFLWLISNGNKGQNDRRFHRLAECRGRSELSQRQHLPNPAIYLRILRPRKDLIIKDTSFVSHVSLDSQWLVKLVLLVRSKANPIRIVGADRLKEAVNRLLFNTVLRQNSRRGRKRPKQYSKQKHRQRSSEHGGEDHRPESVV